MTARKSLLLWALAGVTFLAIGNLVIGLLFESNLEFIERITGLDVGDEVNDVDTFDNSEWFVAAHVRVPPEVARRLVATHDFELGRDSEHDNPIYPLSARVRSFAESCASHLEPENRVLPPVVDLAILDQRSACHSWECIVEQNTGRIWVLLKYPDPAGQCP